MKAWKKFLILALLGSLSIVAAETTVDEDIAQIKNAPAQERVRLMNQFKIRLRSMNEADREAAITALRTQTMQQERVRNSQEDDQLRIRNQVEQMNQMKSLNQWKSMGQPGVQNGGSQQQVKIPMH